MQLLKSAGLAGKKCMGVHPSRQGGFWQVYSNISQYALNL